MFPCSWVFKVLFIFWRNPLSDICIPTVFSQSVACLFNLLTELFEKQKFLILMKPNFSIDSFVDYASGVVGNESITNPRLQRFSPRSVIVFGFTFMSMIQKWRSNWNTLPNVPWIINFIPWVETNRHYSQLLFYLY